MLTLMSLLGTKGTMFHSRGQQPEAIEALRAAVQLAPEDTQHHLDLGQVLHAAGRYDEEQEVYKKAIEVHPGLALAYSYLAVSILSSYQRSIGYRSYGKVEEDWVYIGRAEALFNKSLDLDPACGLCHGQIGDMNKDAHRINQAIEHYTKSARLLSHMPTVFCNLVYTKMYGCDWSDYESDFARILALVRPTAHDTWDTWGSEYCVMGPSACSGCRRRALPSPVLHATLVY